MTQPRIPTPTHRAAIADKLELLAHELRRQQAADTMRLIAEAIDGTPYPNQASGTPRQPHNQTDDDGHPIPPDTPTETAALNRDPTTHRAATAINNLWTIHDLTRQTLQTLWSWRPDRAVATCERCGHPYQRGYIRCQQIIDGQQCGATETLIRYCDICGDEVPRGQQYRQYQQDGVWRCAKDWKFRHRNGYDRNTLDRLKTDDTTIIATDNGVAHA